MKRLLLAVLLLWAATLIFPGLGERVEPRVMAVRGWVWDRAEGPLSPVINRYRRTQADSDLTNVARALVNDRSMGLGPPEQADLRAYMARHQIIDDGLDPWGTPYLIVQEADSVAVISAGHDLTYHTEHDLVIRVRFARRSPARRPVR